MRQMFSRRKLGFPLILSLAIILTYSNSIHKEFMLDDYVNLIGDDSLKSVGVGELFTKDFKGFYRPVTSSILKTAFGVFGENPIAYHLYNAVIFFMICWLFYFLLKKLTGRAELAMLASLLYAVHPINNFFLNYKTAGNLSLNILFLQLGVLFFMVYLERKKIFFYAASVLMYAVSLLAHEINFILPVFLFLIMYYFKSFDIRRDTGLFIPFAIVFMLYFLIRTGIATATKIPSVFAGLSVFTYLGTLMKLIVWYVTKLFVPAHIIFIWDERLVTGLPAVGYTALFVLLAAVLVVFFWKGRRRGPVAFGLMLFAAGLVPLALAGFIFTGKLHSAIIEPHWFGFSSIGFFVVAAAALLSLKKFFSTRVVAVLIFLTLATLGALTHAANGVWKTEEGYCRYWILENSINGAPWNALAKNYILTHNPGVDPGYYKDCREASYLGFAYHVISGAELSFAFYSRALEIDNSCAPAYYGLSLLYDQLKEVSLAASNLNQGKQLDARFEPMYRLLRDAFHDQSHRGDGGKIIKYFEAISKE